MTGLDAEGMLEMVGEVIDAETVCIWWIHAALSELWRFVTNGAP